MTPLNAEREREIEEENLNCVAREKSLQEWRQNEDIFSWKKTKSIRWLQICTIKYAKESLSS